MALRRATKKRLGKNVKTVLVTGQQRARDNGLHEIGVANSRALDELMARKTGTRHNAGKPRLSLVMEARHAMESAALILCGGLTEYGRGNWRKGLLMTEVADSALRHITAWLSGEDRDLKTGEHHLDYLLCNAIFLAELRHTRPDMDDRCFIDGKLVRDDSKG